MQTVFITGGTGYIGSRLIKALLQQGGFHIKALVREGSRHKLPAGCEIIFGNALDAGTYRQSVPPATIFIHLIGVAHPSPAKKEQFKNIDLVSVQEAVKAAEGNGIQLFIYLSVAMHPTRIMRAFQEVRATGESLLSRQPFTSVFIRPWYVLGPGHWWPLLLKPVYWLLRLFPATKQTATALDTVTIAQLVRTIVATIKTQPGSNKVINVAAIKKQ